MFPFWRLKVIPIPCPSGEQIADGGFESGGYVYWNIPYGEIVTDHPHTGSYCVHLSYQGDMDQTLATPILVECIKSFKCWIFGYDSLGQHSNALVRVTYTDDITTVIYQDALDGSWSEMDILPYLTAGKTVKSIYIKSWRDWAYNLWIDDVSLIGKG